MPETIERMKVLRRQLENVQVCFRQEGETETLTFSASSEAEVDRWYGTEVLSHRDGAVRLGRVKAGALPILFNHGDGDPIGMVDEARLEKGRLILDGHLFGTERAGEVRKMIDGGLRNVSIAYRSYVIEEDVKAETYTVTDWELLEVSIVTVPADPSVGIGRSADQQYEVRMVRASQAASGAEGAEMADKKTATAAENAVKEKETDNKPEETVRVEVGQTQNRGDPLEMEKARKRAIGNLCKANRLDDKYRQHWIGTGISIEEVSDELLKVLEERGEKNPEPVTKIGISTRETKQFSLLRAVRAAVEKDWSKAPFELECSREVAKRLNKAPDPDRFLVPFEVLERKLDGQDLAAVLARQQRDLTAGTAGAGGYLVATDNIGFIEMVRNRSVAFRLGARRLSGLVGDVTIPRQSAAATGYWLANEATDITESQQTFVQLAMTPKNAGAYTEISRQLLLQSSPGAEGIVTDDLAIVVALAADVGVLNGSGASGQPTGILNTSGIGSVSGSSLAYADILEFQEDLATANVMPLRGGYATTPAVASLMLQRVRFTSTDTPLWVGNIWDGIMSGFPAMSSNQIPSATMIFGDWSEVVVAEWGVLEVETNPYANFKAGIIGVRAIYSMDVGVRKPFAFSAASSIT